MITGGGWKVEDGRIEDGGWKVEDETKEIFYFLFSIFYLLFGLGIGHATYN